MLAGNATDGVLDPDSGTVLDPDTDTEVQGNLQVVYRRLRVALRHGRGGRGLHEPQPGPGLGQMNGRYRQSTDRRTYSTGLKNVNPGSRIRLPTVPAGGSS